MHHNIRHPDFEAILVEGAELLRLATGYQFVEGPAWHPGEEHLTFSDIAGDTMYRWVARRRGARRLSQAQPKGERQHL